MADLVEETSAKMQKLDNGPSISSVAGIKLKETLSENSKCKTISLEALVDDDKQSSVVILEKSNFDQHNMDLIFSQDTHVKSIFQNDIYGKYECKLNPDCNLVKMTVIRPATEKHIEKYRHQDMCVVDETANDYEEVVKPYILSRQFSLNWVQNILDHKAEADRIVDEDMDPNIGFVLIPDLKWNVKNVDDMHLCCIVRKPEILSVRELSAQHLPLLKNIMDKCLEAIWSKYDVPKDQVRAFFHYQPSYYHLHIHFCHLKFDAPGINMERGHLLSTVIANIDNYNDYYKRTTMTYTLRKNDELLLKLQNHWKKS